MKHYYISSTSQPTVPIGIVKMVDDKGLEELTNYPGKIYLRIHAPEDLELELNDGDIYTTHDNRKIGDFEYDIMVIMWDGQRKIINKDADVNSFSAEQVRKWNESLRKNPETAYRSFLK